MSDIELAVTVDVGSADADKIREQLTEIILAFAAERGLDATATPEDHWLEHELAAALRAWQVWAVSPGIWIPENVLETSAAALRKYDLIYGEETDDEQAPPADLA